MDEIRGACEALGMDVDVRGTDTHINGYEITLDGDEWTLWPLVGGGLITLVSGSWDGPLSAEKIQFLVG